LPPRGDGDGSPFPVGEFPVAIPSEAAVVEKKKLEDKLAEEKRKTKEANAQFNALTIGKVETLYC
jgi:hypothetical protein